MKPAPTIQKGGIAASSSTQFAVDMALPDGPASYMPSPPLSEQAQAIYASIRPGQKGNVSAAAAGKNVFFSKQRLAAARPSPTIVKTAIGMGIHEMCPPNSVRGLSIGEVRRLCSFPDQYEFVQTGKPRKDWVDAWGIMGNSVPPLLMRAVAEHIRNEILAVAH
jgi:DNA (cytosine-5)-methyltransferase 1